MSRLGVKFVNRSFFLSTDMKLPLWVIEERRRLSGGKEGEDERPEESDVPIRVDE